MRLDWKVGYKPLDFGGDGLSGSINQDGRIIAMNTYHPQVGYVTMTSIEPFPETERYHPEVVRAYRRSLVEQDGFGLKIEGHIIQREVWLQDDLYPCVRLTLKDGSQVECLTYSVKGQGVVQRWTFGDPQTQVSISGRLWLQRSAYTQLTEGGPVTIPSAETQIVSQDENGITLYNPHLQWAVCINPGWAEAGDEGSIIFQENSHSAGQAITLAIGMGDISQAQAALATVRHADLPNEARALWGNVPDDLILRRGLTYTLLCSTPISLEKEARCILTDHMILPLSWNRDSYFAARALLSWKPGMWRIVRGHLLWMFEEAERIDGLWGRSYLANGCVKDRSFQLDQQFYPVVELLEYVRVTRDVDLLDRVGGQVASLFGALELYRHPNEPLYRTEETPADDPAALPYPLSSHILLWYMLRLMADADFSGDWAAQAENVREAIYRYFTAEYSGTQGIGTVLAYATDCEGHHHFYHDANDFPLVLAPVWGFCTADDPLWQATVDFAFSPDNEGGYYDGHLGSVHTPAPWVLGDIQEMIAANLQGDMVRYAKSQAAVRAAAQWDGALSEAYDAASGGVVSRHWFVWPNAAYACLMLGAFTS